MFRWWELKSKRKLLPCRDFSKPRKITLGKHQPGADLFDQITLTQPRGFWWPIKAKCGIIQLILSVLIDFFNRVIQFAQQYGIAVCHDGPYSEVVFDDYQAASFMQADGAKETGVEFHSLSKTYNMTGWRIGMVVGNAQMIDALKRLKSKTSYLR